MLFENLYDLLIIYINFRVFKLLNSNIKIPYFTVFFNN